MFIEETREAHDMDNAIIIDPMDNQAKAEIVKSLIGIIPDDGMTLEQAREERLGRYDVPDEKD